MSRYGQANPNYRHGHYCGDYGEAPGHYVRRAQLQECLQRLLNMDLTKGQPTPVERRWLMAVIRERPEWAVAILTEHGFKKE